MHIPLEMLIDYLGYLNPEVYIAHRDLWVNGVKILTDDGRTDPNYLYFTTGTSPRPTHKSAPYVLVCPKSQEPERDRLENCILLHTDVSLSSVFNEMLGLTNLIRDWRQELELSIGKREGVQKLIDISARVFGNPMAIVTSHFKTVAATWEIETDDPLFWELTELGYITRDTYTKVQEFGLFLSSRVSDEPNIVEKNDFLTADCFATTVSYEGEVAFNILMLCSNLPMSRGIMQLYNLFLERINVYLKPAAIKGDFMMSQYERFIVDIIEDKVTPREINERTLVYPATFASEFCTVVVAHESSSVMFLEHAKNNLSALFPNLLQIQIEDKIILFSDLTSNESRRNHFISTLESYLTSARGYAGVSEPALGIISLKESYREAREALNYGRELLHVPMVDRMISGEKVDSNIFFFKDYQIYCMLSGGERTLGILDRIRGHDLEHGTDYYRILFVFLSHERNYSKTAAVFSMHRNNIIYHTKRICEIFNLDLEDHLQRLRLLMLYRLADMGAIQS